MEHALAWLGTLWRDPLYGMLLRLCVGQALVLAGVCVTVAALRYHRLRDQEATQLTASEAHAPLMAFLAEEIDELRAASVLRMLPRDKLVDLLERLTANLHGPSLERLQLLYAALRLRRDAAWLVRSWRWWRRLEGVRLYGAMGGSMSHAPLLRALRDRHPSVRMAAARALGRIQSLDVLPSLLGALGGGMFDLSRRQIAAILVSMGPTAWPILRAELDKPAYQPGQLRLHTAILEVLALSGDLQARGVILRALRDPEEELRIAGFKAAVLMHLSLPAEELRRGLGDERWTVRAQAARACGHAGRVELVPDLGVALSDPEWWVRFNGARALGMLKSVGRGELERLAERSQDGYARDAALQVLTEDPAYAVLHFYRHELANLQPPPPPNAQPPDPEVIELTPAQIKTPGPSRAFVVEPTGKRRAPAPFPDALLPMDAPTPEAPPTDAPPALGAKQGRGARESGELALLGSPWGVKPETNPRALVPPTHDERALSHDGVPPSRDGVWARWDTRPGVSAPPSEGGGEGGGAARKISKPAPMVKAPLGVSAPPATGRTQAQPATGELAVPKREPEE